MTSKKLKVSKIEKGTVIDHINPGKGPKVLKILNLENTNSNSVIMGINVSSSKYGNKDILKVEDKFLNEKDFNKIAVIAPNATINKIKNFEVKKKKKVAPPKKFEGIIKCPNRNCVTNHEKYVKSIFLTENNNPLILRCYYCEKIADTDEIKIL